MGFGLGYVNIFFILPKYLTQEQIGVYKILIDVSYLIFPFLQLGGASILNKFFFEEEVSNRNRLLSFVFSVFLLFFIVFAPVFILFKESILSWLGFEGASYEGIEWLILAMVLGLGVVSLLGAHLRNYHLLTYFNLFSAFWLRIAVMITFVLFGFGLFEFWLALKFFVTIVLVGVVILWLHSFIKTKATMLPSLYKGTLSTNSILSYGSIMLIGVGSAVFIQRVDTVMTSGIIGLKYAGIYGIAMAFSSIIEVPRRSVTQVLVPIVSKAFKEEKLKKVSDVYTESSVSLFFLSLLLFVGLIVNLDQLLSFLPNAEDYLIGKWVVVILAGAKVFDALWGINTEILVLSKYFRYNIGLLFALLFLTVGFNLIFINETLLITGTAIATGLTILIYNTLRGVVLYWKFGMLPFNKSHLIVALAGVLGMIPLFVPVLGKLSPILYIALTSSWICLMFAIVFFYFDISDTITSFRITIVTKLKAFF